jgi:hypothetical protein
MSAHDRGGRLVRFAARALPPGPLRERYRQEFLAELQGYRAGTQLRYSIGVLTHVVALRMALGHDRVPVTERDFSRVRKPILCRLHVHFRTRCVNEDGDVYHRCHRCGDDQYEYERHWDENNVAGNVAGNIIGGGGVGGGGVGA